MRVINFAQGALLMAGMFMAYWLWELGGVHPYLSRLVGIDAFRIYGGAYALSAALMGVAAAVLVPFFYVHPGVGTSFLLKVFVIVVLGGLGSMPGAAVGGILVGLIEGIVALYVQAA